MHKLNIVAGSQHFRLSTYIHVYAVWGATSWNVEFYCVLCISPKFH